LPFDDAVPTGSRWRIEALRRFTGETVEEVLARRFERGTADPTPTPVTDDERRWMDRVIDAVRGVHRDFLAVAESPATGGHPNHIQLIDDEASVTLSVTRHGVSIFPLPDYLGDAAAGFALMWQLCQALARDAGCVIVDPSTLEVIEMELDVDRAREEYGWI
jgi:hypothetical protein